MKNKPYAKAEDMDQWLNKNEIEQFRTADEYIKWCEEKLEILQPATKEFMDSYRLHEGIAKDFLEELFPLYKLIQKKRIEWQEAKFKPVIGGHSHYDVIVESSRNDIPKYIEMTCTCFDEEEKARMELLNQNGQVDMLANVNIKKPKGKKKAIISLEEKPMYNVEPIYNQIMGKIKNAINKKSKVKDKPENTALLVYFDDSTIYDRYDEFDIFGKDINNFLREHGICVFSKFSALYIVGERGNLFFERNQTPR